MSDAIISVGIFSFFINLLMLTGPLYMLQVYDRVLSSQSMSTLVSLSMLMAVLYMFVWLLDGVRSKVLARFANKVEDKLSERTFEASLRLGLGQSESQAGIPLRDLSTLRAFFASNAMSTLFDLPWVPVYLGVIFLLHWTMGIFAVVGAVVIVICAIYVQLAGKGPEREEREYKLKSREVEDKTVRNAGMVKAMGMEGHLYARWNALNSESLKHATKGNDRVNGVRSFSKSFRLFLQSGILGIGAALAINQIVSPGSMIAGSIILGRALTPAQSLISQWTLLIAARAAFKRLDGVHSALEKQPMHMDLPAPSGWLEVKGLVGGAPGSHKPILRGLNFQLSPGDSLGITGPSASGKSSLAKFLVGNWIPQQGEVRLDGATFQQWHACQMAGGVGKHIGYLPQNVELFTGSIMENIARFDPNATEQGVLEAAYRAGIHEMILSFPQGYGTSLGDGGFVLSGGQTQRIALARALYGDPCLVVLDEPNANLDDEGEKALKAAILDIRHRGKTAIIITHRMKAISGTNKLLVIKNGSQTMFGDTKAVLGALRSKRSPSNKASQEKSQPVATNSPELGGNSHQSTHPFPPNPYASALEPQQQNARGVG